MKHLKNITISLFTASLTILFVYGSYAAFAAPEDSFWTDFEDADYFWTAKYKYHWAMNDYFNEKFEKIHESLKEDKDFFKEGSATRKLLTPPTDEIINNCEVNNAKNEAKKKAEEDTNEDDEWLNCIMKADACGTTNLSTYCTSMGALQIHLKYLDKLDKLQEEIPDTNDLDCYSRQTLPVIGVNPTCVNVSSLSNLLGYTKERNEEILAEYDSAKRIMEVALNGYNEFILAYPMHKKYEAMLESLTKYKNALKRINRESMKFPFKFIGTSSYSCS